MPRPNILPIKYMDDLHTNLIGCSGEWQFMIIEYYSCNLPNVYVVRYLFHMSGEFHNVKHAKLGIPASEEEVEIVKNGFLSELEPYRLCDIRVQLFEVDIDSITFGLLYSEETESVDLEPRALITFTEPWDGEYNT